MHLDYGVSPNCKNPDSFGEICVKCGQCGRKFDGDMLVDISGTLSKKQLFGLELTAIEEEQLQQLKASPVWDGDLVSKSSRDNLVTYGFAFRYNGFNYITELGVKYIG